MYTLIHISTHGYTSVGSTSVGLSQSGKMYNLAIGPDRQSGAEIPTANRVPSPIWPIWQIRRSGQSGGCSNLAIWQIFQSGGSLQNINKPIVFKLELGQPLVSGKRKCQIEQHRQMHCQIGAHHLFARLANPIGPIWQSGARLARLPSTTQTWCKNNLF